MHALTSILMSLSLFGGDKELPAKSWNGEIVQHGEMRQVIGQLQHQARVRLPLLVKQPHFYGVGALPGLAGEVTIHDGRIIATRAASGGLATVEKDSDQFRQLEATLLVGAYVPKWKSILVNKTVPPEQVDSFIAKAAKSAGLDVTKPFPFVVEGKLANLHMHVIHGACPVHARLHGEELPKAKAPVNVKHQQAEGMLVGIYAANAAGRLTHPTTSAHTHVILREGTGQTVTGHDERVGLASGAVLKLPVIN